MPEPPPGAPVASGGRMPEPPPGAPVAAADVPGSGSGSGSGPSSPETTHWGPAGPDRAAYPSAYPPAPAPSMDGPVPADAQWRRLDRRMLFVHPVSEVIRFLPALIVLFLFGRSSGDENALWHLAPVAVVVGIGVMRYFTTSYRITPEQIQLRKGLFSRHVLSARLDRVRTVDLTARPIHRLLGLSKVVVGTGSASGKRDEELALDALGTDVARGLRAELLHQRAVPVPDHGPAVAAPADPHDPTGAATARGGVESSSPLPGGGPPWTGAGDPPVSGVDDGAGAAVPTAPGAGHPTTTGAGTAYGIPSRHGTLVGSAGEGDRWTVGEPAPDRVLVRLDPAWVRFAPLTTSGLVAGAAAFGFLANLLNQASGNAWGEAWDYVSGWSLGWTVTVLLGVVALLVGASVLAIAGYVLTNWGLVVSHNAEGHSYHLRRGLLTTRETSIDESRVRGLEIGQPLGLRLAGGGRLAVIVTGLTKKRESAATLVPPAPEAVVAAVGEEVLGESGPLTAPLVPHGAAARRRRYTRALVPSVVFLAVVVALVVGLDWPRWLVVLGLVPVALAVPLAASRYAALGHALTGRYLVVRSGTFSRRRDALECDGIIGWNVRASIFQRRAGVATLTATTAAGRQAYTAYDLPDGQAVALADAATPGMLSEFLT